MKTHFSNYFRNIETIGINIQKSEVQIAKIANDLFIQSVAGSQSAILLTFLFFLDGVQ